MTNPTPPKAFLSEDPHTWTVETYAKAVHLVRTMRELGVPEEDGDLAAFVVKIGRYHRAQFEQVNRGIDVSMLYG